MTDKPGKKILLQNYKVVKLQKGKKIKKLITPSVIKATIDFFN